MPQPNHDLRRQPWAWRIFSYGWQLYTRYGGSKVVLQCNRTSKAQGAVFMVRDERGALVELTPEHPIAKMLGLAPEMLEVCRAVAASPIADGEQLTVDAARNVIRLLDLAEEINGEPIPSWVLGEGAAGWIHAAA